MSLTVKDLRKVYRQTFDARSRWKKVLLELGLDIDTIKSIAKSSDHNPDDCYLEGLTVWLKGGQRSWRYLVEALSSPTVGHTDIAKEIERKHLTQVAIPSAPSGAYRQPITGELVIFTNERLGTGAFGLVFKGSYRGMPCAVKVLHHVATQIQTNLPAGQVAEGTLKTFDRECEFLKSFQHQNIVKHLSSEKHPTSGNTILVVELMDCNLRVYFSNLGEESLSSDCQLSLSRDVASGLTYIHSKHIIHRDLCGDNILLKLVQPVPIAKISDFGMSKLLDRSKLSSTLTAMGHRMGYLPPEAPRLEEEQYDYGLDVFSLGVIIMQIVNKLETVKTPKDRSIFAAQIPDTHVLKPLINVCLQEDMRRRPSASQVCDELNRLRSRLGGEASTQQLEVQQRGIERLSGQLRSLPLEGTVDRPQGPGQREVDKPKPPPRLTAPSSITFNWRRLKDRPYRMFAQPVAVNGVLYIRGSISKERETVYQYTPESDHWEKLLEPPVNHFTVATVNGQLLVVGGVDKSTGKKTNTILTFNEHTRQWVQFYPVMPTAVTYLTVIGYQDHLIIAGGEDAEFKRVADVNILNTSTNKWITAEPLPTIDAYYTVLIEEFVYLVGLQTKRVVRAHVPMVISGARSGVWESLPDTPFYRSTPVAIDDTLLIVGGRDSVILGNPTSNIYMYDPKQWTKVGNLPQEMFSCHCTVLSGELFVLGGFYSRFVCVAKLNAMC